MNALPGFGGGLAAPLACLLLSLALLGSGCGGQDDDGGDVETTDGGDLSYGGVRWGDGGVWVDGQSTTDAVTQAEIFENGDDSDGCPGAPGCACSQASECASGGCIASAQGQVCATPCGDGCPTDSACIGGDGAWCLPRLVHLCDPCTGPDSCQTAGYADQTWCVAHGAEVGAFCAVSCGEGLPCPSGYSCGKAPALDGQGGALGEKQVCLPSPPTGGTGPGACACSPAARTAKAKTSCARSATVDGATRVCAGTRSCGEGGLSPCDAPTPAAEVCDGVDQDCDGETDVGANCSDGDPCTVGDACVGGKCLAGLPKTCTTTDACVAATCQPKDGTCALSAKAEGAACDDGDPCTTADSCAASTCAGKPDPCDDGKACTIDSCSASGGKDGKGGCVHTGQKGACDDGDKCTVADTCDPTSGACAGVAVDAKLKCDDDKVCTADTCDPKKGCQHTTQAVPCDDGDPCTAGDGCDPFSGKCKGATVICQACKSVGDCPKVANPCNGVLVCDLKAAQPTCKLDPASVVVCSDAGTSACKSNTCDPKTGTCTGLVAAPEGKGCNDGDPCSLDDACKGGSCVGFGSKSCDDGNACTADSCAKDGCSHQPTSASCDDGDPCTTGDACKDGACAAAGATSCDDGEPCTKDSCVAGAGCKSIAIDGACDDGDPCTPTDSCKGGTCIGGGAKKCDDGEPCTDDSCVADKGCVTAPNLAACDDGDPCTVGDQCAGGSCVAGKGKDCGGADGTCKVGVCLAGACTAVANDSLSCSDDDPCTTDDSCKAGSCQPGAPKVCTGGTECATVACSPTSGGCATTYKVGGSACSKGQCDGKGVCQVVCGTQPKFSVDGCSAAAFVATCKASCQACKAEGGFTASNDTGCDGASCFARVDKLGLDGFVAMRAQPAETAHVDWSFGKTLCGKYRIYADLPDPTALGATPVLCSSWSYVFAAKYLLREGDVTLESKVVNQSALRGSAVLLFERDMTGVTSVRLGNQAAPAGCQQLLADRLRAEPL